MSDVKYAVYYKVYSHIVSSFEATTDQNMLTVLLGLLGLGVSWLVGTTLGVLSNFGIYTPRAGDKVEVETTITYNVDRDRFEYKQNTYSYRPQASGGYYLDNKTTFNDDYIHGSMEYRGLSENSEISGNMN
ncbi:hypothetical protein [Clostridium sp.]|jgi:hypothetical protein|uniref:hypothetical protein n=1 Tax=Clostridium sp. TaxID=1506 RepID=UPI003EEE7E9F